MDTKSWFKKAVNLLTLASFLVWNMAAAAPEGGTVAQGNASISQSGNTTTVNQTSQNTVINWQGFDTAQHEAVKFNQPNSSSIALNRINSGTPTNFQGSLSANGQVWILNPSGVLFGASSKVDVAGLLVTTHNITDSNFMNGHYQFTLDPSSMNSKIINNGLITAKDSGMVGLVAPWVENNGVITANLGKVYLSSGSSFVLDMYGDELINFGSSAPVQNGYVSNSGLIQATGGKVHMTARSAAGVLDNVISMSGTIEANAVSVNQKGEIVLNGGHSGTTKVSGKLRARGGGHIETSGGYLIIDPATEIDAGQGGSWLIDPYNITITTVTSGDNSGPPSFTPGANDSTIDVTQIQTQLNAGTNVTVDTGGLGSPGSQAGDITVATPITWTSTSTLTLSAFRNIYLNADITALNGGLTLSAVYAGSALTVPSAANVSINSGSSGSHSATGVTANINVKDFHLSSGVWFQVNPALPQFNISNSFKLSNDNSISAGISHSFMRALGGTGAPGTPYQLTDIYGVQGINASDGSTLLTKSYILANNIDATGTRTWNNGLGFHPIGFWNTFYQGFLFQGNFDGNYNVINGLYVNRSQTENLTQGEMGSALFAVTGAGANIHDIGLTNVDITSLNGHRAAGLVAFGTYQSTTTISNSYVTGKVTTFGGCCTGGVVGYIGAGFLSTLYNNATITANGGSDVGGVVGYLLNSTLTNSYNVGNIFAVGSVSNVGGLVGTSTALSVITNTYNSGPVNNAYGTAGALVGSYSASGGIFNSYFDTQTSIAPTAFGSGSTSGVTGLSTAAMMVPGNFVGWTIADGTGVPASNVFSGATPPSSGSFTWLMLTNNTRPMLNMEWSPSIKTPHQVQLMAVAKAANYSLAYNIDMYDGLTSAGDVWGTNFNFPSGAGFFPIGGGSAATAFTGSFNGNNLIINNLYINRPTTNWVGLFGVSAGNGTTFQNVGLTNVNITGQVAVGALIGQNGNSFDIGFSGGSPNSISTVSNTITNVYSTGVVNAGFALSSSLVGGLIGFNSTSSISLSYSTANVNAISPLGAAQVGGFVGDNNGTISTSYASGTVTTVASGIDIGGFLGYSVTGTVDRSYSSGNIFAASGSTNVGGFIGRLNDKPSSLSTTVGTITNSYSVSNIFTSGSTNVGGFVGREALNNNANPIINTSYSSGSITGAGNTNVGGFGGSYSSATTTNNFWDTQSSGTTFDGHTGLGVTGQTTAQMQTLSTFTGGTWDITNVPSITSTAPAFTWFIFAPNSGTGYTRPMLMMENNPKVASPHAVQMMGAALGGNYTLVNNIDFTNMFNNVSEVWATNRNLSVGEGFVPVGNSTDNFTGTVNGNGQLINALYINKTITAGNAGLFGIANNATIRNLSVTNASISQSVSPNASGIIAGILSGTSSLTTSYASGAISNTGDTGGLVGNMLGTSSIANAYNLATVTSNVSGSAGGVVGNMVSGTPSVTNTYNTNTVTATTTPGGVIGNFGAGTLLNNVWDTQTSNISSLTQGCGSVASCAGTAGMTTAQMMDVTNFTTPGNGFVTTPWSITATSSTSRYAPNFTWFEFNATNGKTRPMLMIENNFNVVNAHQLQMMGAALGGTYQLLNNIDLTSSFTDIHDVWATNYNTPTGLGFVPVGAGSAATAFQGFFRGQNYIINNLYINRPTTDFIGLFGTNINNGATINNVGLTNVNVTGQKAVGGIVGQNSNTGASGFTGGTTVNQTGFTYSDIFKVYVTGSVNATSSFLGGVIGFNSFGIVSYSYETANVTQTGSSLRTGGFVGENMGVIFASYAAGSVTTQVAGVNSVGGFAGLNFYGVINQSYSTGSVYAANGNTNVGGFVGLASSSNAVAAQNSLTNNYSFSNVITSGSTNVGGFVGSLAIGSGNVPTISNSFSMGAIIGSNTNQGGFGGNYAATAVTANNFWDTQRSGVATDVRASGQTTIGMMTPSTFSTWNTATIWNILSGHTYPFLRVFYSGTPQAISGTSTVTPDSLITIALNGSVLNLVPAGANSFFYVLNGLNNVSSIDTRLPSGGLILAYQSGSTSIGNDIAVITSSTASLSGIYDATLNPVGNGLILSLNTVTAGNTGTISGGLSNAQLSTAKGALSDVGILYSVSGTDLTNNINKHFETTSATTYTVDGNIALTNGNATFNGPLLISASSPTISTTASGIISFLNTVNGTVAGTQSLTVNNTNPTASSIIFSSPIGATAALNNLTLSGNTQYNSGIGSTVFVTGAEVYNNDLLLNNIPTLSLNGASVTFGGAVTSLTTPTSLTIPGNLMVNSTGSIGQSGQVLNSLTVTGTTNNGSDITTTNNQLYSGVYTLTGNNILTSNAGSITFNSTVDSNGTPRSLTLDAFLPVTLTGNIGSLPGGILSTLHIINQTNINTAVIHTVDAQLYDGVVLLGNNTKLTVDNGITGQIIFGDTVTGPFALVIDPPAIVQFNADVNTASLNVQATQEIQINTANILTSGSQLYDAPAVILQFNPGSTLTSTGGNITVNGTITGPFDLFISMPIAAGGQMIFNGAVNIKNLTVNNFFTIINAPSMTTSGTQIYNSSLEVTFNQTVNLTGTTVTIAADRVTGLIVAGITPDVTITGNAILASAWNFSSNLPPRTFVNSLTVTGTTDLLGALFNPPFMVTQHGQTYGNTVTVSSSFNTGGLFSSLGGTIWLKGALISGNGVNPMNFSIGPILGAAPVTVQIDGQIGVSPTFNAGNLNNLNVTGTAININTSAINTNGTQTYTGPVILFTDTVLTSVNSGMSFSSTVDSDTPVVANARALTLVSPLTVTLSGNIGSINKLKALTIGSGLVATPATITTPSITTTTSQTYFGPVTVGNGTVTSVDLSITNIGGNITFNNIVNAGVASTDNLTISTASNGVTAGTVTFNGVVGGGVPLNTLTVIATGVAQTNLVINTSAITTQSDLSLNDAITLNASSTLLSNAGNITVGYVGAVNSASNNLTITATTGAVTFFGSKIFPTPLGALTINAASGITLEGFVTTNLSQLYNGNVQFTHPTTNFFDYISNNGDITFEGTLGTPTASRLWTIDVHALNGTATFNGILNPNSANAIYNFNVLANNIDVNANMEGSPLSVSGSLQLYPTTVATINGNIGDVTPWGSLVIMGGTTNFNGAAINPQINTIYFQEFVTNLNLSASTVTLNNQLNGPLNGSFGANGIYLEQNVVGTGTDLVSNGDMYFGLYGSNPIVVSLHSITVGSGFITDVTGGTVSTVTTQNYNGEFIIDNIGNNNAVNLNGSVITFNGAVIQNPNVTPVDLIITGNMVANAPIGPSIIVGGFFAGQNGTLLSLTVNGQSNLNGGLVNTTNNQLYNGAVLLGVNNILTSNSGNITFSGTLDNTFDLTVNANEVRFKDIVGGVPLGVFTVNADIINFDTNATSITSLGTQTYAGAIAMTIGLDPVFTAPNFVIAIPVVILADTTYTSTAGDIDFQSTVDGPANLILNPTGTAIFQGDVGFTTPLASLVINGLLSVSGATVINTDNYQTYGGLVTLNNSIVLNAGTLGCTTTNCVAFTLGTIGVDGITGPGFDLSVFTFDSSKGGTGAGIAGTVNVANFTMGGTGGGDISPLVPHWSTVGGATATGAWDNTFIAPGATGLYCVNGSCTSALIITATDDTKIYGQLFTPTLFSTTGLSGGDSISSLTLTSTFGSPTTATVLSGPYSIIASNASSLGITNNHYTSITYVPGSLTVNPASLTITSTSQTKNFGTILPITTAFFTSTPLPNGETIGTVDITSAGLPGTAPVGNYSITFVTGAAGGTFDPTNYSITYVSGGNIFVIDSLVPPNIIPNNVPPTQEFIPPVGPNCGVAGCDNLYVYIDNLIETGVTSCAGNGCAYGFVLARDTNGNVRILMQGEPVYIGDTLLKEEDSCLCVQGLSGKKVCYGPSVTKVVHNQ